MKWIFTRHRKLRHTASHVMAQAVKDSGPRPRLHRSCIESGFYYDFDKKEPLTDEIYAKSKRR